MSDKAKHHPDGMSVTGNSPFATAADFEREYAARSNMTVADLRAHGLFGAPCACGEAVCEGWQMEFRSDRIYEGTLTFYPHDDGHWSVSENQQWVPGCYDTKETARAATAFESSTLQAIQDTKNPDGFITMKDLPC